MPGTETDRRKLNILEAIIIAALIGMGAMIFGMRDAVIKLQAAQESTNLTLTALQLQLADIPALRLQAAELKVRVERHDADIVELKQTRDAR